MPRGRLLWAGSFCVFLSLAGVTDRLSDPIKKTVYHMLNFNKYLFTHPDSLRILVGSAPIYGMGLILDDSIHGCFYCKKHHKNINQFGCSFKGVNTFVDVTIGVEIAALMLLSMVAPQDETRVISHVFIASYPFALAYKDVIKELRHPGGCRPKNEYFNCRKKVYNGFPSGHTMEAAFMAMLFGKIGLEYALPLWSFAGFVAVESIVINRHTLSQVIAGATLGILFGAAARKTAYYAMNKTRNWDIVIDRSGGIALSYERSF